MFSTILIGISLSFDSLAVSVASGGFIKESRLYNAVKLALYFGFFQGLMTFIGWFAGVELEQLIVDYDHWVAFILLTLISGKIFREGLKNDDDSKPFDPTKSLVLIGLAIATSIDAMIVGITFGILQKPIIEAVLIIALTTFLFSISGVWFSCWLKDKLSNKIELIGGIILFGIGLKILIEHTLIT